MNNFYSVLTIAGNEVLSYEDSSDPGQFETNKNALMLLINERNKLLLTARVSYNEVSKQKYINARNNVKDTIRAVKSRQILTLTKRMSNINKTLKDTQKAIDTLKQGFIAHYTEHIQMKFKRDNGTLTSNNRENIILLSKYF